MYKLRKGVVLVTIAGENILVALRDAWNTVPFTRHITKRQKAYLDYLLHFDKSKEEPEETIDQISIHTDREKRLYRMFKEQMITQGYLVNEEEDK